MAFTIEKTKKKKKIFANSHRMPSGRPSTGDSQPPKNRI
jgi:hypothetical protein